MPTASGVRPADSDADLEAFSEALAEFMRAVRRARGRIAVASDPAELSLSQFHVLDALERSGGPLQVGELALGAGVAPPTVTRMLAALESNGLVVRDRSDADRRVVHVALTAPGQAALDAKRTQVQAWRRAAFTALSAAEREQAAQLLTKLAASIEDHV
jgi:DNA-binding MarR family transcriptional regulator